MAGQLSLMWYIDRQVSNKKNRKTI
jgi:hypothetical protein